MANSNIPAGFKPVKYLSGAPWNGKASVYYIPATDSTAMFKGDAVKSAGSADATGKFPTVAQAAAGNAIRGVIVGFGDNPNIMTNPDNPNRSYRPASTAMYCLVVDDPMVIFEVQEDSDGAALAAADVGLSVDIVVGTGSTVTGKSAMELDSSTKVATAATCKLLRLVNREDNALGDNAKWEVLIAEHEMKLATGV
jgi:hypothetical protein